MKKTVFSRKMSVAERLADYRLSRDTVESIIEQVDACNGIGDVIIPAGQAAFLLREYGKTLCVREMWKSIGV
jgi:polygalacturonase